MFEEIFEWDILLHHSASIDSGREILEPNTSSLLSAYAAGKETGSET